MKSWLEKNDAEKCVIKKNKNTVSWTYVISALKGK